MSGVDLGGGELPARSAGQVSLLAWHRLERISGVLAAYLEHWRLGMTRGAVKLGCLVALCSATACMDFSSTPSPPPEVDVTGTWTGQIDSNTGPPGYSPVLGTITMTLHLTQSGSEVTGSMSSDSILVGSSRGAISARRVQLTITVPPCGGPGRGTPGTLVFVGDVDADGRTMQVHYLGTECSGDGTGALTRS